MIEAPLTTNEEEFMYAVVPLRSAYFCQVGLFDQVQSIETLDCYGRGIRNALRS